MLTQRGGGVSSSVPGGLDLGISQNFFEEGAFFQKIFLSKTSLISGKFAGNMAIFLFHIAHETCTYMYVIRYARTAHGPRTHTRFAYKHSTHTDPRQRHSAPMLQTLVLCYTPPFHSTSALAHAAGEGIMGRGSAREKC